MGGARPKERILLLFVSDALHWPGGSTVFGGDLRSLVASGKILGRTVKVDPRSAEMDTALSVYHGVLP